jgi:hypothetical protein
MKNQILVLALVLLGTSLFGQKAIEPSALAKMDIYVQVTQGMYTKGMKVVSFTNVGSNTDNIVPILGDDGKDYIFNNDADMLNFMDKHGFDFVSFNPPLQNGQVGMTIFRQAIFKKK